MNRLGPCTSFVTLWCPQTFPTVEPVPAVSPGVYCPVPGRWRSGRRGWKTDMSLRNGRQRPWCHLLCQGLQISLMHTQGELSTANTAHPSSSHGHPPPTCSSVESGHRGVSNPQGPGLRATGQESIPSLRSEPGHSSLGLQLWTAVYSPWELPPSASECHSLVAAQGQLLLTAHCVPGVQRDLAGPAEPSGTMQF